MQPPYSSYEDGLYHWCRQDERFVVLTAENRSAIRGLPAKLGERFIDVGICEQTMIGAAAGLALRGRIPVVHALATFLTLRAFEFIRTDVGIAGLPVKLVGTFTGLTSEANGPTHQALEDVALLRGIPGMTVWCPADEDDLLRGLDAFLLDPAPGYLRYCAAPPAQRHAPMPSLGQAEVCAQGSDVTLLTYGVLFRECVAAASLLRDAGLSVGLINLRSLKPVDSEAIASVARNSRLLVVVEDHFKIGGLYSIVAETLLEQGLTAPVLPVNFADRWFKPALLADVLAYEQLDGASLARRIQERLQTLPRQPG